MKWKMIASRQEWLEYAEGLLLGEDGDEPSSYPCYVKDVMHGDDVFHVLIYPEEVSELSNRDDGLQSKWDELFCNCHNQAISYLDNL